MGSIAAYIYCRPQQPSLRVNLDTFSSEECKELLRFRKEDIPLVIGALGMPEVMRCSNGTTFLSIEGFMILAYSMAFPNRLIEMKQLFHRSEDDLSRIFNYLLMWIRERWIHLLRGRNICVTTTAAKYYNEILKEKTQMDPFPVFAFIDGTLRPCARPSVFQYSIYNGMDRVHGLKYLIVLTPDGMMPLLSGPHEGAHHDSWCFKNSFIETVLENRIGREFTLYGDQGFANCSLLLTAYRGAHLNSMQSDWNRRVNACRTSVERGIGKVCTLWTHMNLKEQQKLLLRRVGPMYEVAVLLTNVHTTLYGSETAQYFNCEPPQLLQYISNNY